MKCFFKCLCWAFVIVIFSLILFKITAFYKVSPIDNHIQWSIDIKGIEEAVDFQKYDKHTYVAFKNRIEIFEDEGKYKLLLKDDNLNIEKIILNSDKLYFLSYDKLFEYDIKKGIRKIICSNIPCQGENIKRQLFIKDKNLLISIGCATNSGIAENNKSMDNIPYDISAIDIVLNGNNYGENETGAYMPYGNSSIKGQKIKGEILGNSSVVMMDLQNYKISPYASGLRNITGLDIDSENNLMCIVEGAENIGSRPIDRDCDYVYTIEKGKWYGWPDYSGGDPINSPRFRNEKKLNLIISNPPTMSVPGPFYVFEKPGCVENMAIDKKGNILNKDAIIYWDKSRNMICSLKRDGIKKDCLKLQGKSCIKKIEIYKDAVYILDNETGCIYKMKGKEDRILFNIPREIIVLICIVISGIILIIIYKLNRKFLK